MAGPWLNDQSRAYLTRTVRVKRYEAYRSAIASAIEAGAFDSIAGGCGDRAYAVLDVFARVFDEAATVRIRGAPEVDQGEQRSYRRERNAQCDRSAYAQR